MNEIGYKGNEDCYSSSKRSHLTNDQRMPRCYKDVEKIIKSVKSCRNNFKTVMAQSRLRGAHFKKVYNLSLNVLKCYNYIQKLIDKTGILTKETFLRREIASVLIYELIYGNGYLPGESKIVTIVQTYEKDILKTHQELQNSTDACELNETYIPRYVRVHTLKTSVAYVIKDLESYGFQQIMYEEDISEEKYLELVRSLERRTFLVDFHFKDILVFAQDENLVELDLYKNGHIFLQDKASYIPVHVLNPDPGSTVLDACAAPGMKSAHIASKMENKGTLIACERDAKRFEILKETLEYGSVKIAKTLCTDFKLIDPNDKAYASVEYILLDPSCSGSGMVNRMDEVTNNEDSTSQERIKKLAGFQIILLKHALKFPSVKRVVYSTCSIHEEENEYVVHEAVSAFENSFKLVPVLPKQFSRGSENYRYGEMCLRTNPTKHLTNGFFVAAFERIDSYEYADIHSKKYKKFKSSREDSKKTYTPDKNLRNAYCSDRKTESKRAFKQESCECNESIDNSLLDDIDKEGHFERNIDKKENCAYEEISETVKNSVKNTNECKESDYLSNKYDDASAENVKNKSHKKKNKKSKYTEHTSIEMDEEQEIDTYHYKAGKQINDFSDSFPDSGGTNVVQSPTSFQTSSEIDNILFEGKKSKHKKSRKSKESFDITEESCKLTSEHESKKNKKRKYSEISSHDTIPLEVQNNVINSEVLPVSICNDSLNKKDIEDITICIAKEDKNLETSLPKKHKKKKKKEHKVEESSICNVNPSKNLQTLEHSNESVNFSTLDSSDLLQTGFVQFEDNDNKQITNKKHKHKKHSRKSDCDVLTESLNSSFSVTTENTPLENYGLLQPRNAHCDDNDLNQTKSKKHKHKKHDRKSDCDVLTGNLNNFSVTTENTSLENSDLLQTGNVHFDNNDLKQTKSKKHKHKKHDRKSDCDVLTGSLDNNFSITTENNPLENSDHLQIKNTLFDNNELQTKSKKHKHKKHDRKPDCDVTAESLDNSFSLTINKESNYGDAENTSVISLNESHFQDKKRTKRKSKIDESLECINYSNTSLQNKDLDQENSDELVGSKLETVIHNEFPKRKKSKKHKSHSKD